MKARDMPFVNKSMLSFNFSIGSTSILLTPLCNLKVPNIPKAVNVPGIISAIFFFQAYLLY